MASSESSDRIDILPLLIAGLIVFYLFYLLRPPLLMFWHYNLNMREPSESSKPIATTPPKPTVPTEAPPLPPSLLSHTSNPVPTRLPEAQTLDYEIEQLTNKERVDRGRSALQIDPDLREIAVRHSWDMLEQGYMDHVSPDGAGPTQRVGKQHRRLFGLVSENVALIDSLPEPPLAIAEQFMEIWMNSQGHRRNILSEEPTHLAAGCYQRLDTDTGQEQRRCTQLFTRVFAWAEQAVPERVSAGSKITFRIQPAAGSVLPTKLLQVNLRNGRELSSTPLTPSNGVAVGALNVVGPGGLYGLQLYVPDPQTPGRYWIVRGPYISVP